MKKCKGLLLVVGVLFTIFVINKDVNVYARETSTTIPMITYVKNKATGIKIKWADTKKVSGYVVYRSEDGEKYEKIDDVKSKKYVDTNVNTGELYRYKIKSYTYIGKKKVYGVKSGASAVCMALPDAVSNVKVVNMTNYRVLSWKINLLASGYDIYRSSDKITWEYLDSVDFNEGIYMDSFSDNTPEYYYKVSAYEIIDGEKYNSLFAMAVCGTELEGIDVSYHNGKINWKKVKQEGIDFAMIRLGYGTSKGGVIDSKFDYNFKQARKNGIKVGVYLYSYADNIKEAKKEAKFVMKVLQQYDEFEYPVVFDFENDYRNKKKYKKTNTKIITTFCDYLEKRGYDTSVYSFYKFLKKSVNHRKISRYGIWLAKWTNDSNSFDNGGIVNVQMWQYSALGKIKGIQGNVDLNLNII